MATPMPPAQLQLLDLIGGCVDRNRGSPSKGPVFFHILVCSVASYYRGHRWRYTSAALRGLPHYFLPESALPARWVFIEGHRLGAFFTRLG